MSVNLIVENGEQPVPLDIICRDVPGEGEGHAHEETLKRWARVGVRGVRLETVLCGMRRCTSREALGRFYSALTRVADNPPAPGQVPLVTRSKRQARKDHCQAVAELKADGVQF
jgi:hypothetical protein